MTACISLTDDGKAYIACTEDELLAYGVSQATIDDGVLACARAAMHCTPRQARLALAAEDLLTDTTTWVATQDEATQISWEFATEILRTDPMIIAAGAALSLSDEDLDDLFTAAAAL